MAIDPNPYAAPGSLAPEQPPTAAEIRERWLASMRGTSNLAIYTGITYLAASIAAPFFLMWHNHNILRQLGQEKYLDTMIEAHVAPLYAGFVALALVSGVAIAAGVWIRRLDLRALYVLVIACTLLLADTVSRMLDNPDDEQVFRLARAAWLVYLAGLAWTTSRQERGEAL
jgi:hypothetical protein